MLYMLGGVVFELVPTNLDAATRERGQDWAAKAIVGAQKPREAMGVADAPVTLSGKLFPHRYGMGDLETLAEMAQGTAPRSAGTASSGSRKNTPISTPRASAG
jgi:phage protein U